MSLKNNEVSAGRAFVAANKLTAPQIADLLKDLEPEFEASQRVFERLEQSALSDHRTPEYRLHHIFMNIFLGTKWGAQLGDVQNTLYTIDGATLRLEALENQRMLAEMQLPEKPSAIIERMKAKLEKALVISAP